MYVYRHRQPGTFLVAALGTGMVMAAWLGTTVPEQAWVGWTVAASLFAAMIVFSSLTVTVTDAEVRASFGPGLFRWSFPVEEIRDARAVRNPWYYGWGIHGARGNWLLNVSGFDAVELELASGRKVRVGTDQPQRLLAAIRQVLPPAPR